MKTIQEKATEYEESIGAQDYTSVEIEDAYYAGATEQKAIDDKRIKLLEEHLSAFKAFCENIINGMYVSVKDAAKEQLQYIKTLEEEK